MYYSTRDRKFYEDNKKEELDAYLLWLCFGFLGAHRIHLGRPVSGFAQMAIAILSLPVIFSSVGAIIWIFLVLWIIVDVFLIPGMVRERNAALISGLQSNRSEHQPVSERTDTV